MDISDIFPGGSARPNNPDFWRLSSIVLKYDGRMDEARTDEAREQVWTDSLAEAGINGDSLFYMGLQRAMRAMRITTRDELRQRQDTISMMATLYAEGALVGISFEREKASNR